MCSAVSSSEHNVSNGAVNCTEVLGTLVLEKNNDRLPTRKHHAMSGFFLSLETAFFIERASGAMKGREPRQSHCSTTCILGRPGVS